MLKKSALSRKGASHERGFTLFEVIIAVLLLGILSIVLGPAFRTLLTARAQSYAAEQLAINQKIAAALTTYSEYGTQPAGMLPAPCNNSTNKFFYGIYQPTYCSGTAPLLSYLLQQGVPPHLVNEDGTDAHNVRVYQRVDSVSQNTFLFYQSGPEVALNYDVGVVYTTNCSKSAACNVSAASSTNPPKSQPVYASDTAATAGAVRWTSSNLATWTPGLRDVGAAYFTTLPQQKKMLQATAAHLDRIRSALTAFVAVKQAAAPTSTANFYPQPIDVAQRMPAEPNPGGNQGCREGWYDLSAANSDILAQVGLSTRIDLGRQNEYGWTAWGGTIEYCRDYDPTLTSGYGVAPHFAALRINNAVSYGMAPDPGNAENNALISF